MGVLTVRVADCSGADGVMMIGVTWRQWLVPGWLSKLAREKHSDWQEISRHVVGEKVLGC